MKRRFPAEFVYQVFALIIAIIVVHAVYVTVVRPKAAAVAAEQILRIEQEENYTPERSVWVIIRDFEQESCFILMIWAFALWVIKRFGRLRNELFCSKNLSEFKRACAFFRRIQGSMLATFNRFLSV